MFHQQTLKNNTEGTFETVVPLAFSIRTTSSYLTIEIGISLVHIIIVIMPFSRNLQNDIWSKSFTLGKKTRPLHLSYFVTTSRLHLLPRNFSSIGLI
jgi:hypothetical protein